MELIDRGEIEGNEGGRELSATSWKKDMRKKRQNRRKLSDMYMTQAERPWIGLKGIAKRLKMG